MSIDTPDDKRFPLRLTANASQHLVLLSDGKSFELGPMVSGGGHSVAGIEFSPESGDKVSFVTERCLLSWPTPFNFNFMTGQSPSWKRHLYYRLVWTKPSGAALEMLWRYEQYFFPANGWASGFMTKEGITGLRRVEIRP